MGSKRVDYMLRLIKQQHSSIINCAIIVSHISCRMGLNKRNGYFRANLNDNLDRYF